MRRQETQDEYCNPAVGIKGHTKESIRNVVSVLNKVEYEGSRYSAPVPTIVSQTVMGNGCISDE